MNFNFKSVFNKRGVDGEVVRLNLRGEVKERDMKKYE